MKQSVLTCNELFYFWPSGGIWVDAGVSNTPARKGVKVRVLPWLLKDTDSNFFCFFRIGKVAQLVERRLV